MRNKLIYLRRQQTADSRQQTADSRQQTADSRQQTADSRQQTADSRQQTALLNFSKQQGLIVKFDNHITASNLSDAACFIIDCYEITEPELELAHTIRQSSFVANSPIIYLCQQNHPANRVKAFQAGASDCLCAPYETEELLLRLQYHLQVNGIILAQTKRTGCPLDRSLFSKARAVLKGRLAQPPSLTELASLCNSNSKRLNNAFKSCTNMTVFEYLRELRMQQARHLLLDTPLSISDIANTIGFARAGNFSTAFRERYGKTPQQYRTQNRS